MFEYQKRLEYPVKISNPNPALAKFIISQYGGPDGELGASLRYLSQRYSMPYPELKGLLTDIGVEESHLYIFEFKFTVTIYKKPEIFPTSSHTRP
jgi:spore coat protein JC